MRYAVCILLFAAMGSGCTHSPMATISGTATDSLHSRVSKLTLPRVWLITYHNTGPGYDTTYHITDTFALVLNSDSAVAPFVPYSYNVLSLYQYNHTSQLIAYSWNTTQSNITDHSELSYYYGVDSVAYVHITANQGGMSWQTTCTSAQ